MAVDLSAYIQEDERQKTKLYRSIVTNDVVSLALQAQNPEVSIQKMLEKIGQALGTERVFIFEHAENDCCSATYEWNKAGLVPMSREWQNVPERMLKKMYEIMERKKAFVIRDVRKMEKIHKLAPELYWKMVELQIRELICLELKSGGKTVGFFGVINPTKTSACNAEKILLTLSRYISIFIRNRDMVKRLDLLGSRDALTGVMNRRAFRDVARNMNENASIAVIYGDVNGLKMLNDTKGHDAGDELIKATADVMSAVVGSDHVFRMGGDEFLIVVEMDEKVELDQMMQKLRDGFDKEGISVALGSVYHAGVIKDVDELMHEADRRMYINKQSMHEQDH
jgi:diguanylate cyclase (GGDEF)-like protein